MNMLFHESFATDFKKLTEWFAENASEAGHLVTSVVHMTQDACVYSCVLKFALNKKEPIAYSVLLTRLWSLLFDYNVSFDDLKDGLEENNSLGSLFLNESTAHQMSQMNPLQTLKQKIALPMDHS
jgi:hypothetical protein